MPRIGERSHSLRSRSQCKRAHLQSHSTRRPTRMASSGQLMAHGSGLLLPRFDSIPLVHRLVADDRLAVMLAKTLVGLDIAVPAFRRDQQQPL